MNCREHSRHANASISENSNSFSTSGVADADADAGASETAGNAGDGSVTYYHEEVQNKNSGSIIVIQKEPKRDMSPEQTKLPLKGCSLRVLLELDSTC